MSDEIAPALTPEQWTQVLTSGHGTLDSPWTTFFDRDDEPRRVMFNEEYEIDRPEQEMAVLNAALADGSPYKLTHEDVTLVFGIAHGFMLDRSQERLARLADKIAALLPPGPS